MKGILHIGAAILNPEESLKVGTDLVASLIKQQADSQAAS